MSDKIGIVLLVVLSIFIGTINGQSECKAEDCCRSPAKGIDRLELNSTLSGLYSTFKGSILYEIFGSKASRLHVAQVLKEKEISTDEVDLSTLCARFTLTRFDESARRVEGHYSGFENDQFDFLCQPSDKEKNVLSCDHSYQGRTFSNNKDSKFFTYANDHLAVVVKCLPDGTSGWHVASKSPTIDINEKKKILDHVKALGFDPADEVPMYTEKCSIPKLS